MSTQNMNTYSDKDKVRNSVNTIEDKVRKDRAHPYTRELNNIKASIYYYKKLVAKEENEDKKQKYQDKIDELEFSRYMYKLNTKQIDAIQKYCEHYGLECLLPTTTTD